MAHPAARSVRRAARRDGPEHRRQPHHPGRPAPGPRAAATRADPPAPAGSRHSGLRPHRPARPRCHDPPARRPRPRPRHPAPCPSGPRALEPRRPGRRAPRRARGPRAAPTPPPRDRPGAPARAPGRRARPSTPVPRARRRPTGRRGRRGRSAPGRRGTRPERPAPRPARPGRPRTRPAALRSSARPPGPAWPARRRGPAVRAGGAAPTSDWTRARASRTPWRLPACPVTASPSRLMRATSVRTCCVAASASRPRQEAPSSPCARWSRCAAARSSSPRAAWRRRAESRAAGSAPSWIQRWMSSWLSAEVSRPPHGTPGTGTVHHLPQR